MAEVTDIKKNLNTLRDKTDEFSRKLSKALSEGKVKAEENIKRHPLPYVAGTLAGGMIIGSLMTRKRRR